LSGNGEWANCSREEYAGALVINPNSRTYAHRLKGACKCGKKHAPADPEPAKKTQRKRGTFDCAYRYFDQDGTFLYEVVRRKNPRGFYQRRPKPNDKGKWLYSLDGARRVLYRLPELLKADPTALVFVVEGEKDVETLHALGLVATCNPEGALKWRPEFAEHLRDRIVIILPDNDDVGRKHALLVARSLVGIAREIKVVTLPDLPEKGDVSDWMNAGGTAEQLLQIVQSTPQWTDSGGFSGFSGPPLQVSVNLRSVPKLDPRMIPEPFRAWLIDIAERASCPLDLPTMAALVAFAARVGRKVAIRPKCQDDLTVVANLWGMGVLPPGWLKTHTLGEGIKPLARLEIEAREQHKHALERFAAEKAMAEAEARASKAKLERAAKKDADRDTLRTLAIQTVAEQDVAAPTLRRYIVNDTTVEKLGELLNENPNGLVLYRDELMGFLKNLEKQGHENDRAFYLEAWNGDKPYTYDRIGRGSVFIDSMTVSILGGIQPSKLSAYIRSMGSGGNDDGFIPRFQLAVYPDTNEPYRHIDRWPDGEAKNRAYAAFHALDALDPATIGATVEANEIPYLHFSEDAQGFFDSWREALEPKVRTSRETAALVSHLAKYRSLMPSLALLFHLIDIIDRKSFGPVSLPAARCAAAWCHYLEEHARRIYQLAFDGDPEPAQRLAERIKESLPSPFAIGDVVKKGWSSLPTVEAVERAVAMLEEHNWVKRREIPPGPQGGRPKVEIHINPLARGGET
jgi:putative DNA primase/helicase